MDEEDADLAALKDPRIALDLELVRERMSGTKWESLQQAVYPVEASDVDDGTAARLAECLAAVESDLVVHWVATAFGTLEAQPYAADLLEKFPRVATHTHRWVVGLAFYDMSGPELADHLPTVLGLVRDRSLGDSREMLARSLPLLGPRGPEAALALLADDPEMDRDMDFELFDGLAAARVRVPDSLLERYADDERAYVRKVVKKLTRASLRLRG